MSRLPPIVTGSGKYRLVLGGSGKHFTPNNYRKVIRIG
jgi:hypothetical protein